MPARCRATRTGLENGRTYRFQVRAVNAPRRERRRRGCTRRQLGRYLRQPGHSDLEAVAYAEGYVCEEREPDEPNGGWSDINFTAHCPTSRTSVTIFTYPYTTAEYRVRAYRTIAGTRYYGEWAYTSISSWEWP